MTAYDSYVLCLCADAGNVTNETRFSTQAEAEHAAAARELDIINTDTTADIDGKPLMLMYAIEASTAAAVAD